MNIDRVYNKVVANFATGIRGDLAIADFQKLSEVTAHLLLEFQPQMGKPRQDDVERYFAKTFEGKICPVEGSISIKKNAISVVARINSPKRDIKESEDATKMVPVIAGLMYIDTEFQEPWEVKEEQGKKVLAKTSKENIEQIIAARRNRMFVTKTPSVSLASLGLVKSELSAGDVVKAFHKDQVIAFEIKSQVEGGFKGCVQGTDKEFVLAKEAALDVMQQALDKAPNESAKIAKYFEEAYGDKKYAKDMVKSK
jgi:hypothetical protein